MSDRTRYSKINIFTGLASKVVIFLFAFSTRTAFARLLGTEYAGVDGLYSNILSVLSLADLGISNVFSFFLYQSLAKGNNEQTAAIVYSFRKLYVGIGLVIFGCGSVLIPVLPLIVDTSLPMREVILYYILYLLNVSVSYFFAYRTAVLVADQKQFYSNITSLIFQIVMYSLQLLYLLMTHDFTGYLIIMVLCTIGNNVALNAIAVNRYPYLRNIQKNPVYAISRFELWNNLKATFIYRVSSVILTCTDNIVISTMIGTVFVGKYAYYYLLLQYVVAYARLFGNSVLAGIGNLNTEHNQEKSYRLFEALNMFFFLCAVLVGCAFINCIQQFIPIWVGEEFLLDGWSVIAMVLYLYIQLIYYPVALYRESMGLFVQVQYIQIPAAILNIGLSILLGYQFGISGVLFATSIAILLTLFWYEPYILYKRLGRKPSTYFAMQIHFFLTGLGCAIISFLVCRNISSSLAGILLRFFISIAGSFVIIWLRFRKKPFWKEMKIRVMSVFPHKRL